jgi:hemerythrin superfamily protein
MSAAAQERSRAAELPEGDVVRLLLEQHARIRDLFTELTSGGCDHKQEVFDELRALLAVHETAEEMVVRPVSKEVAGASVAEARNHEEAEANEVLAQLEKMDLSSGDFETKLVLLEKSVSDHADAEEQQEFSRLITACDEQQRASMGAKVQRAESIAPTHPHPSAAGNPSAVKAVGPFASLVDRAKDALAG